MSVIINQHLQKQWKKITVKMAVENLQKDKTQVVTWG